MNIIKKFQKKQKRKKLMKQKAKLAQEQAVQVGTSGRKSYHRHKLSGTGKKLAATAVVVVAVCLVFVYVEKRSYHSYKVLNTSEQEDVVSTQYVEMDGDILRYSPDGVSVVDSSMNTVWNETYTMQNPIADVNGSRAVVADSEGTSLYICDKKGITGTVTTSYSIVKVRIAANGMVAAILDNDENTWINFYNSDGSLVAENLTKIDDPGYPMDVAVSDNGVMMVTFQYVDGSKTTSYVAFYNYGDVGQNEDDRIVSGYTYENAVIPQVECISESQYIALRDDGFSTYQGNQIPKESKTINVKQEIVSTFFDDERIGLVFKNNNKDSEYTMEVYNMNGQLKFRRNFNVAYSTIKMSGGNIIMYNSSQICVMNSRGVQKYMGSVDGTIRNFFKIGWNKYLMVMDNGVSTIKFS